MPTRTVYVPRRTRRIRLTDVVLGVIAAAVLLLGAREYMSHERTIYFWDDANFSTLASRSYRNFFPPAAGGTFEPGIGLSEVYKSFGAEYSLLYTLPVVLFQKTFGQSRTSFIVALMLFYFVPYCVAWSLVATRLFRGMGRPVFWGMFALSVAMPLTWMSVMHGYPDVGAGAILGVAVYLYLIDVELRSPIRCVTIGLLLAVLPPFRRHYVFAVIAFFGAAVLQQAYGIAAGVRRDPAWLRRAIAVTGRIALIGAAFAAGLAILAWPFVALVSRTDYFGLYSSYMEPPRAILAAYLSAYGLLFCIAALVGHVNGLRFNIFLKPQWLFVALLGTLTLVEWTFVVRQLGIQYMTQFSAYFVIGVVALLVTARRALLPTARIAVFAGVGAILVYRLLVGFAVMRPFDSSDVNGAAMAVNPPQVRRDIGEIKRLLADLRLDVQPGAVVYVAASSAVLNADIIRTGEIEFFGAANRRLNVPTPSEIDSRDWFPIESLVKADYVITAEPVQYSVSSTQQKTVRLVAEAFDKAMPIASDFTLLQAPYRLVRATVRIYKRHTPTATALAVQELAREETVLTDRPGGQKPWLSLDRDPRFLVSPNPDGTVDIVLTGPVSSGLPAPGDRSRRLILLDRPAAGGVLALRATYRLAGAWVGQTIAMRTMIVDAQTGVTIETGTTAMFGAATGDVSIPIPVAPAASRSRVILEVTLPEMAVTTTAGSLTLSAVAVR